ncbi:MAG: hypothetical protein F4X65_02205 [Chloroflexi bacterium]|nr:hypothetical protein [Chloroflexota bacterium]
MAVILDANALINLYRAEILSLIYLATECIVPAEVYAEAVTNGQMAGYPDSSGIAEIIGPCTEEFMEIQPDLGRTGRGETAVLRVYLERRGNSFPSDDQRFLRYLERMERSERVAIRHLGTPQFIVQSTINGLITKSQALDGIASLGGGISEVQSTDALQRLETL